MHGKCHVEYINGNLDTREAIGRSHEEFVTIFSISVSIQSLMGYLESEKRAFTLKCILPCVLLYLLWLHQHYQFPVEIFNNFWRNWFWFVTLSQSMSRYIWLQDIWKAKERSSNLFVPSHTRVIWRCQRHDKLYKHYRHDMFMSVTRTYTQFLFFPLWFDYSHISSVFTLCIYPCPSVYLSRRYHNRMVASALLKYPWKLWKN